MRCWVIVLGLCCLARAQENAFEVFHDANLAFDNGEYDNAIARYQDLIAQGFQSAGVYFNLANAYFKGAHVGLAIFHYRKALELAPRDEEARANLAFARERVVDRVEGGQSLGYRLQTVANSVSEKEACYSLIVFVVALFLGSALRLYYRKEWLQWVCNAMAVASVLGGVLVFYHALLRPEYGVVVAPEAKVYSGLGKDNVVLFALHEGVEFVVEESVGSEWVRLRLMDGKRGWVNTPLIVTSTIS